MAKLGHSLQVFSLSKKIHFFLDILGPFFDNAGMNYPGGKGGVYQRLINLMPPHEVYIETHLGGRGNYSLQKAGKEKYWY